MDPAFTILLNLRLRLPALKDWNEELPRETEDLEIDIGSLKVPCGVQGGIPLLRWNVVGAIGVVG